MVEAPPAETKTLADTLVDRANPKGNPDILVRLREKIADENFDLNDLASVVKEDTALSERVISVANSAWIGCRAEIEDVEGAVTQLGASQFYDLVLCCFLRLGLRVPLKKRNQFADHSELVAQVCRQVGQHFRWDSTDNAFLVGLFHDCGAPLLLNLKPEYSAMFDVAIGCEGDLPKREYVAFGADHAQLGSLVCKRWKLPDDVCAAIRWHHATEFPDELTDDDARLLALLILAEDSAISWKLDPEKNPRRFYLRPDTPLMANVAESLDVSENDVRECRLEMHQLLEMRSIQL